MPKKKKKKKRKKKKKKKNFCIKIESKEFNSYNIYFGFYVCMFVRVCLGIIAKFLD